MGTNVWLKVPLLTAMDWQRRGLCRSKPGLFDDPERMPGPAERTRVLNAITICNDCPVKQECLAFGMRNRYWGIFGGRLLRGGEVQELSYVFRRRDDSKEARAARAAHRAKLAS